jgi:hypothetical protein
MDAFAKLNPRERRIFFEGTAASRNMQGPIIEKDFWVCWTWKELFRLPTIGEHLIFKGGTSLSKVFQIFLPRGGCTVAPFGVKSKHFYIARFIGQWFKAVRSTRSPFPSAAPGNGSPCSHKSNKSELEILCQPVVRALHQVANRIEDVRSCPFKRAVPRLTLYM